MAIKENRNFIGFEINEKHVNYGHKRTDNIKAQKIKSKITSGGTIVKNKSKKLISFLIDSTKVFKPRSSFKLF